MRGVESIERCGEMREGEEEGRDVVRSWMMVRCYGEKRKKNYFFHFHFFEIIIKI